MNDQRMSKPTRRADGTLVRLLVTLRVQIDSLQTDIATLLTKRRDGSPSIDYIESFIGVVRRSADDASRAHETIVRYVRTNRDTLEPAMRSTVERWRRPLRGVEQTAEFTLEKVDNKMSYDAVDVARAFTGHARALAAIRLQVRRAIDDLDPPDDDDDSGGTALDADSSSESADEHESTE
jgi:hypothetical protein